MPPDEEGPALNWGRHEAEILDLFVTRNKTLKEVMKHMKETHGLSATERQYKYRFHRLKNVSEDEYADIGDECQRRAALGKETVIWLHGRPLPPERVKRGIDRVRKSGPKPRIAKRKGQNPGRITFRTPSPAPVSINNRGTPQVGDLQTSWAAPGFENVSSAESIMLLGGPAGIPGTQPSQRINWPGYVDMDTAVDLGVRIVNTSGIFATDHGASTHARYPSPSVGGTLSPHNEFADFDLFGTHHGRAPMRLMRNLPFFRLLYAIEHPDYPSPGHPSPGRTRGLAPTPAARSAGLLIMAQSVFPSASGSMAELLSTATVADVASQFRILVPERYEGDLVHKLERVLDSSLQVSATLPWLFSVAAFLASNNGLTENQMDVFLRWVIDQGHAESLTLFMKILTPTVHAFAMVLLESAIRIKNVQVLDTLLKCGVKLDSKLFEIARSLGDTGLTERVLVDADPASLARSRGGGDTLRYFVDNHRFDLAQLLLEKGVSADARSNEDYGCALHRAVARNNIVGIKFLLNAGANIDLNAQCTTNIYTTPLGYAAFLGNVEAVVLLLEHGADLGARTWIEGKTLLEFAALSSRTIYDLLKKRMEPAKIGFLLGDLVDAANRGRHALASYILQYREVVTTHKLEKALEQSILSDNLMAAITLLQHGVSPDGLTLDTCLLATAVREQSDNLTFVGLLLGYNADIREPEFLEELSSEGPIDLLELVLASGIDSKHRMKALVRAAESSNDDSVDILMRTGLHVDTPGLRINPLQAACSHGHSGMMRLLISKGANVNAPAHPKDGRTALQAALHGNHAVEAAEILLHHGADASAPPATLVGLTTLEALCNNRRADVAKSAQQLCHKLLDAGATVNRPGGKASSAIHGVIEKGWHEVLARCLEPQHNAIVNGLWWDDFNDEFTPTQRAAAKGDLKALTMLLDYGADVNEAAAKLLGRTALQAAALLRPGPKKMAIVNLLLERGADINADPAAEDCGVTALQAAAIAGDLMLAELFISHGADVNAWSPSGGCRTAIEGAAEHGRLDMVQLLLNAGATGDATQTTGLEHAVKLAEENGHFAVASLLKEQEDST